MTNTALVAGPSERACDVAAALQAQGFATITVNNGETVREACNRVSPRSVDCYVQLPADTDTDAGVDTGASVAGATPGGAARSGRAQDLLGLVDAVAAVAPLLADHATVVIMADEGSGSSHALDRLLDDAVGVLAEAVVADHGSDGVRVSVLGAHESPAGIAAAARRGGRQRSGPSLADFAPDLGYADWRSQVLSLASVSDATYFGWKGADGRTPVVIIRGAVVSPLRAVGPVSSPEALSWGDSGPGATRLARAVLADLLGTAALCRPCAGAGDGECPVCGGTGLSAPTERHVDALVEEILAPLPGEGFELPATTVQAWIDRRPGSLTQPGGTAGGRAAHPRRRVRRRPRRNPIETGGAPGSARHSPVT